MSHADELRAAAEKLRALATAAAEDSGNTSWHTTRHFPEQADSTFTTVWATGVRPLFRGGGGRGRPHPYVSAPVGDYLATMDPTVGAALADWLDTAAANAAVLTWPNDFIERALAVARAINDHEQP